MARWEAGARERLQVAALDLFAEHGFDGVTTARIAEAAGLTERTFFRYFADKREVLFQGQEAFADGFLAPVRDAASNDPAALVVLSLDGASAFFPNDRRPWSRARQRIVDGDLRFQERELLKLSRLAGELGDAMAERGVPPLDAAIAARTAMSVFQTAFQQWIAEGEERSFAEIQRAVLASLRALLPA